VNTFKSIPKGNTSTNRGQELSELLTRAQEEEEHYLQSGTLSTLELAVTKIKWILDHPSLASQPDPFRLSAFYDASRIIFRRYLALGNLIDLDQSIIMGQQAIMIAPQSSPEWVDCANNLGAELRERYRSKGTLADLEQSISLFRQALKAVLRTPHKDQAMYLNNLGSTLNFRYLQLGNIADLEEHISLCKQAVAQTPPSSPALPARLVNLGLGQRDHFIHTGNIADLEQAIRAFEQALAHISPGTSDADIYFNNLGLGLNDRHEQTHEYADLERAIRAFEQAITHSRPGAPNIPLYLTNLGSALANRYRAKRDIADLERSIDLYKQASQLSQPRSQDFLRNLHFSSNALINKYQYSGNLKILDQAIDQVKQTLTLTPRGSPNLPSTLNILGSALKMRYKHTKSKADLEDGFRIFRQAVVEHGGHATAEAVLDNARDWGDWALECYAWDEACQAYAFGLDASHILFQTQLSRSAKESWLEKSRGLASNAAFALARMNDLPQALSTLEGGRALILGENLELKRRDLEHLADHQIGRKDLLERYRAASGRIEVLNRIEANKSPPSLPPGQPADWWQQMECARSEVQNIIKEIRQVPGYETFWESLRADRIQALAFNNPIIYITATLAGGVALVVTPNDVQAVWLEFTDADLENLLIQLSNTSVTGGYLPGQLIKPKWLIASLKEILPKIGDHLMRPLAEHLRKLDIHSVTLIPTGKLALLPLHAASYTVDGQQVSFLDEFNVAYAQSAQALATAQTQAKERQVHTPFLAGVGNPMPNPNPLPFARAELEEIAAFFDGHVNPLYGEQANKACFLKTLSGASHVHLSCHGSFNIKEPLNSALYFAGLEPLTMGEVLDGKAFSQARLMVLSACQTAITDFSKVPDEAIGMPGGFLQAGIPGVVGTLWSVDDMTTALVMVKFYELALRGGMPYPQALCAAQRWLRNVTAGELQAYYEKHKSLRYEQLRHPRQLDIYPDESPDEEIQRFKQQDREARPYHNQPYHWAPFVYYGV